MRADIFNYAKRVRKTGSSGEQKKESPHASQNTLKYLEKQLTSTTVLDLFNET